MNIGWRDKALRRAVLLSLLLLVACGYCLYQFSLAQKSAQRLAALQGHTSSSNCRLACRRAPLRATAGAAAAERASVPHSHRRPDGK